MTHGHAHEEAEHASHHAQDPFDRRVAMSMVVIAAVLAAVKVAGHRTHNEVLKYQIKANVAHTQASDQWSYFQAKKNRLYLYESEAQLLALICAGNAKKLAAAELDELDLILAKADKADKAEKNEKKPKKKRELSPEDHKAVEALVSKGLTPDQAKQVVIWQSQARRYTKEADDIQKEAEDLVKEGKHYQHDSEHAHHQADYFDLGELGVELALVLSSVAILTRRPSYWFAGLAVGGAGLVSVLLGFFMH
jgi:hypothetical protein